MEVSILKERDTPLLSRKRYTLEIGFKGATPSRLQVRDEIANKLKADKALTVVKHVYNRYGIEKSRVIAHVYTKKEDMLRYEEKGLLEKHKAPEKPAEEKPAEKAKSEDAPAGEAAE
ncbi:hypothetical protein KY362_05815 [Candidatus Woesearchaeota archaeon]|nr:hypothetical protein [Candidatus Woesearchaeota archaeon]